SQFQPVSLLRHPSAPPEPYATKYCIQYFRAWFKTKRRPSPRREGAPPSDVFRVADETAARPDHHSQLRCTRLMRPLGKGLAGALRVRCGMGDPLAMGAGAFSDLAAGGKHIGMLAFTGQAHAGRQVARADQDS